MGATFIISGLVGGYRGLTLLETGGGVDLGLRRPQNARGVLSYTCTDVVEFRGHRRDARRRHRAEPLVSSATKEEVGLRQPYAVAATASRRACVSHRVCVVHR